ncbi:hypothetical protein V9K67_17935 [Paraflavisolibacter sp. H34]|uniref:hypothetical protein n=1 Tax=Huijunlia imazamoxiresistens TaxID=3127457 RepID=UPI00301841FA
MSLKKISLISCCILACMATYAQFDVRVHKTTGAISRLMNPTDKHRMNWVFASGDSLLTWQKPRQDWGLGKYDAVEAGVQDEQWTTPARQEVSAGKSTLLYKTKCLDVRVERRPAGQDFLETYTFVNTTGKKLSISGLDLYTPFNDNYPSARIAVTNRCNAHIWPGGHSSYVNALRMGGSGPHLGLVFTKGALATYSVDNRDRYKDIPFAYSASNVRGTLVLNIAPFVLEAGGTHTVQWKLFWHKGWDDFYQKAKAAGFVRLEADRYVISRSEALTVKIDAPAAAGLENKTIRLSGDSLGEHTYRLAYDGGRKQTVLNYLVVSSPQQLVDQRVRFIVDHQQMNDPKDGRYGAYMVFDNEGDTILTDISRSVAVSDKDEGRERLGMGVLVAKWLQTHPDAAVKNSLMRYVSFIREKLQTPDYRVFSTVDHKSRHRGYNYPWVAHLYLETYKLTKDPVYLDHFYGTLQKYFNEFGYEHYSIDFRVTDGLAALEQAGRKAQRDSLLAAYRRAGDFFAATGLDYPKHEVNYEQSIVAPAVTFLCELYQVTKDKKYLEAAKLQLPALEAFNGRQPDAHLNEIALRHWDGYWFGKSATWGDVMPHYWSALTALSFQKYYQCTGDARYRERAKKIVAHNLLNFREDGTASCAYLYPAFINGRQGKFYDAYANDQDWALVFYKEIMEP